MATKTVTLDPGDSSTVVFTVTPTAAKTHHVSVNGLVGSFTALALPAEFEVSDLVITPSTVNVGEEVSISVIVTNIGGSPGSTTITLEIT